MVQVRSAMLPSELMKNLQLIEKKLQKNKRIINGPRKIDLDIIFWDLKIIKNKSLCIPHPRASERDFVLIPLRDISPFFRHPVSRETIKDLIIKLEDRYVISKLNYYNFI